MSKPVIEAATHDPGYQSKALWIFCAAATLLKRLEVGSMVQSIFN